MLVDASTHRLGSMAMPFSVLPGSCPGGLDVYEWLVHIWGAKKPFFKQGDILRCLVWNVPVSLRCFMICGSLVWVDLCDCQIVYGRGFSAFFHDTSRLPLFRSSGQFCSSVSSSKSQIFPNPFGRIETKS